MLFVTFPLNIIVKNVQLEKKNHTRHHGIAGRVAVDQSKRRSRRRPEDDRIRRVTEIAKLADGGASGSRQPTERHVSARGTVARGGWSR